MNKPKNPQSENPTVRQERDFFQTPNYATDLIIPYLPKGVVWECASGNGKIADRLNRSVIKSDIENVESIDYRANFLTWDRPSFHFDLIVTTRLFL